VKPSCETALYQIDFFFNKEREDKHVGEKQVLFLQKKDGLAWHRVQVQADFLHIMSIPRETRVFLRLLHRRA